MKDLRILVVGPANGIGGIAQYINEQIRHLSDTIELETFDNSAPPVMEKLMYPVALLKMIFDIVRFCFLERPDIVHVHASHGLPFFRETFFGLLASFIWDSKIVIHIHGSEFDDFLESGNPLKQKYLLYILSSADALICLSDYWKEIIEEHTTQENVIVLPNAVEVDDYIIYTEKSERMQVLFISQLFERKGVNELIEATSQLLPDYEFDVSIAGKGPLADQVEEFSNREHVHYHGFVSEEKKYEMISQADIFVLPSFAEGLPIVILEAMAGQNAIICTSVGSLPEVMGEDNGHLVPPGDVEAIRDALETYLKNPERIDNIGESNRQLVEDNYSWDAHGDRLISIYRSLDT